MRYRNSKSLRRHYLNIILFILPLIASITLFLLPCVIICIQLYKQLTISEKIVGTNSEKALALLLELKNVTDSQNFLSIGIAILGLAVSVWIGLNIYNILKKNEVDQIMHEAVNEAKLTTLRALFTSHDDTSSMFIKKIDEEKHIDELEIITLMCKIERIYSTLFLHEKEKRDEISKIGLRVFEDIDFSSLKFKSCPAWVKTYFYFKEGEFYYYLAEYNQGQDTEECIKCCLSAIKCYQRINIENTFLNENGYLYNTIGELYLKLFNICANPYKTEYIERAHSNLMRATKCTARANYYRNYGIAIENYKDNIPDDYKRYQKTAEQYQKSITQIPSPVDKTNYLSYIAYASLYLKTAELVLGIDYSRFAMKRFLYNLEIDCNKRIIAQNCLSKAFSLLGVADLIGRARIELPCKFAQYHTLHFIIDGDAFHIREANKFIGIAQMIDLQSSHPNTALQFAKRNYFEAIGSLGNASYINNQLIISSPNSDAKDWDKMIKSALTKN